jgi:hypothetical protein
MDDVEFLSELLIGMIAGPQNKKDTIDRYYSDYDEEAPDEDRWRLRFHSTKAMLTSVLNRDEIRGWSGKSDFYGLFIAFSGVAAKYLKLSPPKRIRIHDSLMKFRKAVDTAKRRGAEQVRGDVGAYTEAVTRAASDISRRTTRVEILERIIAKALRPT